ncbi:MAG: hypothetical protein A3H70_04160 [Candidatus Komeilibacteria bacterium RIFCSPLOWO2_02_FULL_48_11]|uniref:DUF6938 domain-containing protein n=1 Tax=Candidatus Komeilibacteria bacterium RIFCSPLOWO2_02_FULL_48_11 TaxID=1798553 RepID=A0A1G2BPE7_9BACT|nr:MAG: hypothetical protein A3H70_04160 [Candidatus Komeilibacteria bacterium RIFCSPLOWO2_02_FULL_48_11]
MPKIKTRTKECRAWVVAVDMGYGHQRAAYPLRDLDHQEVINANTYSGIPESDKKIWRQSRAAYEFFTRFKNVPLVGELVWDIFDKFQAIDPFYPHRNLTRPSLQLRQTYRLIKRREWGKHLIQKLSDDPRPFITSFFIPAFMAEVWEYPGDIYCIVTDADISRAWAPIDPLKSRIKYLASTDRAVERLKLYGVKDENVFLTGFPLPKENIGIAEKIVKSDLWRRLSVLDPTGTFHEHYGQTLHESLGQRPAKIKEEDGRVWLMFAVGGAGAQREIGHAILKSIAGHIRAGHLGLTLVAGIHDKVHKYFMEQIKRHRLDNYLGAGINVIYADSKEEYFHKFNLALRTTDVLWTKPSELSFYTALGVPIIIAPPIGSQEEFNRYWLEVVGTGIPQENPKYTHEWIIDYLDKGWLAEAALQGYLEVTRKGVENIKKVVFK